MLLQHSRFNLFVALMAFSSLGQAALITSSLEVYNFQIGESILETRSYDGFEQFDGITDLEGFSNYSFRVGNSAPREQILSNPNYDGAYKRAINYNSLSEMLTARPENGSYNHLVQWDNGPTEISLSGSRPTFANAAPEDVVFKLDGVSGSWGRNGGTDNTGVFRFNPNSFNDGDSFTVTMNGHDANDHGVGQVSAVSVADISQSFNFVDNYMILDLAQRGENGDTSQSITLTYTKGSGPANAGDTDPLTFMFNDSSSFELEGEHLNVMSFEDVSSSFNLDPLSVDAAFMYQTVTHFKILSDPTLNVSVPEPATMSVFALGLSGLLFCRSRKRKQFESS